VRCSLLNEQAWRRIAPARKELRNGSSKSDNEPTTTRSTSYGSGSLILVFHDTGRIFSLLFLLSHLSLVYHPLGLMLCAPIPYALRSDGLIRTNDATNAMTFEQLRTGIL